MNGKRRIIMLLMLMVFCGTFSCITQASFCDYGHSWSDEVVQYGTVKSNAIVRHTCMNCHIRYSESFPWRYGNEYCLQYDILDFSYVYKDSTSINVRVQNPFKGAVLRVRIGGKTYKKKLTNRNKWVKIKINRHPYGSKITLNLLYRGRVIGKDKSDTWARVLYAKQVRNGMTKNQVRWTWGLPEDTSSASGGWSYWYYEDGSYVFFLNGSVRFWYDAAG